MIGCYASAAKFAVRSPVDYEDALVHLSTLFKGRLRPTSTRWAGQGDLL